MGLECVMIIMDNSFFSRNGDVIPNRFQAQQDAISALINYKMNDNMETSVGLMTMGETCRVLTTPTNSSQQIYSQYSKLRIEGYNNFAKSIQIAQLSMKNRINKNQKERVVAFIASEIKDKETNLLKIATNFRRNNTRLDIINVNCPQNLEILNKMMEIINVEDESHLLNYEDSSSLLTDILRSSPIMGNVQGGMQQQNNDYMDEELQMVLRISLEEEQKRLQEMEQQNEENQITQQEENKKVVDAQNLVEEKSQIKNQEEEQNEFLNDPQFIKEILGDLKIENSEETMKEIFDQEKKKQDEKKKEDQDKK